MLEAETANIPTILETFLYERKFGRLIRNLRTLCVSFGVSTGSFYATDGSSWRWNKLPPLLEAALQKRREFNGIWRDPPRLVSLGADGDFVLLTVGDGHSMRLTKYPDLEGMLLEYIESFGIEIFEKEGGLGWIHVSFLPS